METRRGLLIFLAALSTGCANREAALADPPATLSGGAWSRQPVERPGIDAIPPAVKALKAREWLRTEYRNRDSRMTVEVFRMPGETSAFELRQKFLGESGAASMNHGSLFVIVRTQNEPTQAAGAFLRLLEAEWLRNLPR